MSDFADLGAAREQELREDALAHRLRESQKHYAEASAEFCAICEAPIPQQRREAVPGVQTCIDCQRELEDALRRSPKGL